MAVGGGQWNVQDRDKERGRDVGRVVQHVSGRCAKVIPAMERTQAQVRLKNKAERGLKLRCAAARPKPAG